jgi:hypothetical protein
VLGILLNLDHFTKISSFDPPSISLRKILLSPLSDIEESEAEK